MICQECAGQGYIIEEQYVAVCCGRPMPNEECCGEMQEDTVGAKLECLYCNAMYHVFSALQNEYSNINEKYIAFQELGGLLADRH